MISTDQLALTITDGTGTFHFAGHPIRFVMKDGEPWFFASDCGKALAMTNIRKILREFPDDEKDVTAGYTTSADVTTGYTKHFGDASTGYTKPVRRSFSTVSLPGLLRMIFQSRKTEAEAFKRYVYHEVIPAIQKTGRYEAASVSAMPSAPPAPTLAELIEERKHKYDQLRREAAAMREEIARAEGEMANLAGTRDRLKECLSEMEQRLRQEYEGLRGVLEPLKELARSHAWPVVLTEEAVSVEALRLAGTTRCRRLLWWGEKGAD